MTRELLRAAALTIVLCLVVQACLHLCGLATADREKDLSLYFEFASKWVSGLTPYRDFPVEYPLLALPFFAVPRLVTSNFAVFRWIFVGEVVLAMAGTAALVVAEATWRRGSAAGRRSLWSFLALSALFGPIIMQEYDAFPALLAFAGAMAWSRGRPGLGGLLTAYGALVKIFPAIVAGPALLKDLRTGRSRWTGVLSLAATTALGIVAWGWVAGRAAGTMFAYHKERGLEIHSVYGSLIALIGRGLHANVQVISRFGSADVVSPISQPLLRLVPIVVLALVGVALIRFWRDGLRDEVKFAGAAICGFMIGNKVLSYQYPVWLISFVAVMGGRIGRQATALMAAAGGATLLLMLGLYTALHLPYSLVVSGRNLCLIALVVVMLRRTED